MKYDFNNISKLTAAALIASVSMFGLVNQARSLSDLGLQGQHRPYPDELRYS